LKCFPAVKRIGLLTPYQPVGDANVARYFSDHGYEIAAVHSLKRPSEVQIAHATELDIIDGFKTLAAIGVDAIVQAGTDLAAIDLAAEAERWLACTTTVLFSHFTSCRGAVCTRFVHPTRKTRIP
jgi:maleate isomerase